MIEQAIMPMQRVYMSPLQVYHEWIRPKKLYHHPFDHRSSIVQVFFIAA
ncbi:MAG: hypothetical protein ABI045_06990 [Flavobacteriales bacterium]